MTDLLLQSRAKLSIALASLSCPPSGEKKKRNLLFHSVLVSLVSLFLVLEKKQVCACASNARASKRAPLFKPADHVACCRQEPVGKVLYTACRVVKYCGVQQ